MNTVTFPYLGLTFEMNPTIQIFGLNIAWYAVIIVAGMILAMVYVYCRIKQFGYDFDQIMEVLFFGIIGGIVGARLYYVIFSWEDYQDNLLEIFNTRNGGLAIYGGIIGALLAALIVFKVKKLPMIPFLDLAMIAFLLGQGIGRWGNFINVEAYGDPSIPCTNIFAMEVPGVDSLVHPCFLYESVWCLLGFVLFHFLSKKRRFDGEVVLWYCMWYGAERAFVEGLRGDSLMLGSFRVSQLLSILLVVAAAAVYIYMMVKIRRNRNPERIWVYADTPESEKNLADMEEERREEKEKARKKREAKHGRMLSSDEVHQAAQEEFGVVLPSEDEQEAEDDETKEQADPLPETEQPEEIDGQASEAGSDSVEEQPVQEKTEQEDNHGTAH